MFSLKQVIVYYIFAIKLWYRYDEKCSI